MERQPKPPHLGRRLPHNPLTLLQTPAAGKALAAICLYAAAPARYALLRLSRGPRDCLSLGPAEQAQKSEGSGPGG